MIPSSTFSQPAVAPHGEFLDANRQTKRLHIAVHLGMRAGQSHPDMQQVLEWMKGTIDRNHPGNIA